MTPRARTRAWTLYETGRDYNCRQNPNQYNLVRTNTEFFIGNQWLNLPDTPAMRALPKPTFNILKRVASLFIASLTGNAFRMRVEPLFDASDADAAAFADAELSNLLEKFHFEYRIRDALFDGAQTGDYCAHFWFDPEARPYGGTGAFQDYRGEIRMELVDGINVMFGNPADRRVENQPWILLVGRDRVDNLRREAKRYRKSGRGVEAIFADAEAAEIPGADDTALYVLLYTKVERNHETTVYVTKATREAVIYENIDTGLSVYPLAWGNWERQRHSYHGRALVTGLIPNQIFINTLFATAMRHVQLMAFPRTVYNADLISAWTNEVGQAIGIRGLQPGQNVASVAGTLPASEMSAQIFTLIDKTMAYTKECLGVSDVQLGNARPENTSALALLQTNAEVPLENIRAGLHEWIEDIGHILLDMMGTFYGTRPVVTRRDGATVAADFDFRAFKHLWLNLRADVGGTTSYNEAALVETLDALRRDGVLTAIQYFERLPERFFPRKAELLAELRASQAQSLDSDTQKGVST
ncbi:MAG: hypothetical protein IKO14_07025 [Oscillibacter sp.]|nr:hypothetical protein [Oscillibacter sp.]